MNTTQWKTKLGFGILAGALLLVGTCSLTACSKGSGPVPPAPAADGKATLAGIDSNANGVRDDVEQYIAESHPASAKERAALTQYAKVAQLALLDANDKALSIQHAEESMKAMDCSDYSFSSHDASRQAREALDKVILNTDARNRAYFIRNDNLGGENFMMTPDSQLASTCVVNPATLPN